VKEKHFRGAGGTIGVVGQPGLDVTEGTNLEGYVVDPEDSAMLKKRIVIVTAYSGIMRSAVRVKLIEDEAVALAEAILEAARS
jgi:hypothetical protein